MESTVQLNIRNSELAVAKEKRSFLTYPSSCLVTCKLEEAEDSVNFVFDTRDMEPAASILKKPQSEQFRFLANCAGLDELVERFECNHIHAVEGDFVNELKLFCKLKDIDFELL